MTDAELVDAAGGWARAENAAGAQKLAVMAEIFDRRTRLDTAERELWWIDPDAAVACELAAALNVSTRHGAPPDPPRPRATRPAAPSGGAVRRRGDQ
ncbi:hypothetical protein [Mycobacterium sp. ITM-2016-00318]|uniref:hypothetical protein n=1 Tax=Mycobacterium sp. ITM-2016-00318 TaxID=2099693 RepID=UPI001157D1B7|nr:hypothetical protein [Mycobacterium sp. ITM-2016-00318]WNG95100.1 hypothetical protein C6A82_012060 [Mycobacterium sp. ITM-2016-00318]